MPDYVRTRVRRLRVCGLRSLRDIEVTDIPDLVVLHGPNGSGKSNIIRAVELMVRWAGNTALPHLPTAESRFRTDYGTARGLLGLEPDDFTRGVAPELRILLEVELGDRSTRVLQSPDFPPCVLFLEAVARDLGTRAGIELWFESAEVRRPQVKARLDDATREVADLTALLAASGDTQPRPGSHRHERLEAARSVQSDLAPLYQQPMGNAPERFRLAGLFELTTAYRRVEPERISSSGEAAGTKMIQTTLRRAALSPDPDQYRFFESLPQLLADAGLFGGQAPRLRPVEHDGYGETRLLFTTPHHEGIPLQQLGTGEQQLVTLITSMCLNGAPIVFAQEPEAHLYRDTQLRLAEFLLRSVAPDVGPPRFDQLWIETHHHAFALAPEYLDVSLDECGFTKVERKPRTSAQSHFYEPGPVIDALKALVEGQKTVEPDTVVFHDGAGNPVTAAAILASLAGDQHVAQQYTEAVTRTVVRLLEKATRGSAA